jgi:hydroxymethylpyrimidine/phosphomethylpyrimidine kinase
VEIGFPFAGAVKNIVMPRLLVIAGSDSSGGAGLQADLKTAQAFHVYVQTAVTAVTAQDTNGVHAVQVLEPALVRAQIEAALSDIGADAIKIGMLGNAAIVHAVADALAGNDLPLVLDPVLVSSSGSRLLDEEGVTVLKSRLLPRAMLVTPNLPEAQALTGIMPDSEAARQQAAKLFARLGASCILFKGGHGSGPLVTDVLVEDGHETMFTAPRQATRHTHGTGCTLSTAIAAALAQKLSLAASVARAHAYVQSAIAAAPGLGKGNGPLGHNQGDRK